MLLGLKGIGCTNPKGVMDVTVATHAVAATRNFQILHLHPGDGTALHRNVNLHLVDVDCSRPFKKVYLFMRFFFTWLPETCSWSLCNCFTLLIAASRGSGFFQPGAVFSVDRSPYTVQLKNCFTRLNERENRLSGHIC